MHCPSMMRLCGVRVIRKTQMKGKAKNEGMARKNIAFHVQMLSTWNRIGYTYSFIRSFIIDTPLFPTHR